MPEPWTSGEDPEARWLLARTKPAAEAFAAQHLRSAGFTYYLPRFWDPESARRQVLFTTYIFVLLAGPRLAALRATIGVRSLVVFGGTPAKVPATVIAALRGQENEHGNVVLPEPSADTLRPGDPIRLLAGPFAGHSGVYLGQSSGDRIRALLTLLGQQTAVTLPRHLAEKAG